MAIWNSFALKSVTWNSTSSSLFVKVCRLIFSVTIILLLFEIREYEAATSAIDRMRREQKIIFILALGIFVLINPAIYAIPSTFDTIPIKRKVDWYFVRNSPTAASPRNGAISAMWGAQHATIEVA